VPYPETWSVHHTPGDTSRLHDVERWASIATAAALMAYGVSRRSKAGSCLALAAAPLAYRGVSGHWPTSLSFLAGHGDSRSTKDALSGDRGIHVRESIRLELPVEEVYRFWRRFENLPRFMSHLVRVSDEGNGRTHWVASGPAGVPVEWDAEIINEAENKVIGWQSMPGSDVVNAGSVTFTPVRGGRATQVTVHLQYAPPAGRLGAVVAWALWREPSQTIREDLRRMKQLLEAGEIATARSQSASGDGA
jgi:uncharacterized membrane protein